MSDFQKFLKSHLEFGTLTSKLKQSSIHELSILETGLLSLFKKPRAPLAHVNIFVCKMDLGEGQCNRLPSHRCTNTMIIYKQCCLPGSVDKKTDKVATYKDCFVWHRTKIKKACGTRTVNRE